MTRLARFVTHNVLFHYWRKFVPMRYTMNTLNNSIRYEASLKTMDTNTIKHYYATYT
jgi:hypothetical protein